jgi:hypothetical protein
MAANFKKMNMKNIPLATYLIVLAVLASPVYAINKCTAADGTVAFQDAPCQGKGSAIDVRPASGKDSLPAAPVKAAPSKNFDIYSAIERREPAVGMNGDQLQQAMGLPNRINTGEYKNGNTQQRIYERGAMTWYVYTDGRLVTAIQSAAAAGAAASGLPCHSGHEIRDLETSASSNSLSEAQRMAMQKKIKEMRDCGKS